MLRDRSVELATSPSSPKKTASKLVEGPFINFGIFPEQIIETQSEESLFLQKLLKKIVADQFQLKKQTITFQFPNEKLVDYEETIENWWKAIDVNLSKEITLLQFSKLMIDKGIVTKNFEIAKLLKSSIGIKIPSNNKIKLSQYKLIFAKAYLRAALMNIYYYLRKLTDRDFEEDETIAKQQGKSGLTDSAISTQLQNGLLYVLKYQRNLVLGGLRKKRQSLGIDSKPII